VLPPSQSTKAAAGRGETQLESREHQQKCLARAGNAGLLCATGWFSVFMQSCNDRPGSKEAAPPGWTGWALGDGGALRLIKPRSMPAPPIVNG
jgi:hypothetical protein